MMFETVTPRVGTLLLAPTVENAVQVKVATAEVFRFSAGGVHDSEVTALLALVTRFLVAVACFSLPSGTLFPVVLYVPNPGVATGLFVSTNAVRFSVPVLLEITPKVSAPALLVVYSASQVTVVPEFGGAHCVAGVGPVFGRTKPAMSVVVVGPFGPACDPGPWSLCGLQKAIVAVPVATVWLIWMSTVVVSAGVTFTVKG